MNKSTSKPPTPKGRVVHCKREKYDVYIGRPSKWGNPYSHLPNTMARWRVATRAEAILKYREYVLGDAALCGALEELKGKVLGCWCHPLPCHGDVLVELAEDAGAPPRHNASHRIETSTSGMSSRCLDCDWAYEYD